MDDLQKYDYIIGGAGLAGLTLAWKLLENSLLDNHTLLLIDADNKRTNDRTWCFWAKPEPWLRTLPISKSWENASIIGTDFDSNQSLSPYSYYKIEGIDYYKFIFDKLSKSPQVTFIQDVIVNEDPESQRVFGQKSEYSFHQYFFKSYFTSDDIAKLKQPKKNFIWQHFLGWKITTPTSCFDPSTITYMDMRVSEVKAGLSFGYILPETDTAALVEYTLFSAQLWDKQAYETSLRNYIENTLAIQDYQIEEVEFGKIPMTNSVFAERDRNIIPIGTLAGTVKPSTGYSFKRNYDYTQQIIKYLKVGEGSLSRKDSKRFRFYDEVLINVLQTEKSNGHEVFGKLYKGNKLPELLKFLDENTTLWEDLKIMNTVPKIAFIKALTEELF